MFIVDLSGIVHFVSNAVNKVLSHDEVFVLTLFEMLCFEGVMQFIVRDDAVNTYRMQNHHSVTCQTDRTILPTCLVLPLSVRTH